MGFSPSALAYGSSFPSANWLIECRNGVKGFTNAARLAVFFSALLPHNFQLSAKGSFLRTGGPAATHYKPVWNPPPPLSFSDIAHFRMDRMSQPLYWPSERPAERTYPEWAMGGRVVCGGERWQWRLGFIFCLLSQWAAPYIAESREAGSSPRTSMQQRGRAPALVTPGSRR